MITHKNDIALTYDENVLRLRLEGRIMMKRILNGVINDMTTEFGEAVLRGELLTLGGSSAEVREYFTSSARKQLGSGA